MRTLIASALIAFATLALSACSGSSPSLPSGSVVAPQGGGEHTMSKTAPTIQRPLSDFLNVQGTVDGPVEFAWTTPSSSLQDCTGWPFGQIDYAGVKDKLIVAGGGSSLNPVFTGSVTQTPNADGTSTVSVSLTTTHAYAVGYCYDQPDNIVELPPYFGYTVTELLANHSLQSAIGNSHMSVTFIMNGTTATTPLPDVVSINFGCPPTPCVKTLKFSGTATGPLRSSFGVAEGTPGTMSIAQINTFKLVGRAGVPGFDMGTTANFVKIQQVP